MHILFAQVALTVLASLSALPSSSAATLNGRATTCNGYSEFCDRTYGNITFIAAHDSYAVGTNNLAANQDYDVTQQLNDGIRMLQMQAHMFNSEIHLCHTSCYLYNGGTLLDYLTKVKSWMDNNVNDVVTLLIVNSDSIEPSAYDTVFQSASLTSLSYIPPSSSLTHTDWPTLRSMINGGSRLVTFLDYGANYSSVSYIIDEFSNIWETAYDVTDTTFDCAVNRTSGDSSTHMYAINHFLDENIIANTLVPNKNALNTTNAVNGTGSLGLQASECGAEYGRYPNFMLVDFYEYGGGSVFEVAASLNGVTYSPTAAIATPVSDTSSSSSSSAALPALAVPHGMWTGALAVIAGTAFGAWTVL